jgi:2-aminoadipate transaminase
MSEERRRQMIDVCQKHGVLILEDDPYCDLRYSGNAQPAIKSMDERGAVIYLMSFSKIISPGLRVGAAVADKAIIEKFNVGKQGEDLHTSNLSQEIVNAYVNSGKLKGHIEEICAEYKAKRDAMLDKLSKFPGGVTYTKPDGGLFIWAELPDGVDALPIFKTATEKGVAFVPGGGHKNTLRINFSMPSLEQIDRGMDILKGVLEANM